MADQTTTEAGELAEKDFDADEKAECEACAEKTADYRAGFPGLGYAGPLEC